ncbi:MAG: hypothetical protein Q7O66_12355 [Dehalococcoidia bacterium]|nr:hypothetical protein [Dehalococcoidia bacterium]
MESADTTRASGLLGWLEEEQHQTKAALGRAQYQLDQLVNLAKEQAGQIRAIHEDLAAARNQLSRVTALDEIARQLRENLARMQSSFTQSMQETEKDHRGQQVEIERNKQAINDIWLRLDGTYKEFEPLLGRAQALSDSVRRHDETLGLLAKNFDAFQQHSETLNARSQIAVDQGRRNESAIEGVNRQLDNLRGQDELLMSRLQIVTNNLRQIDEQTAAVLAEEQLRLDLAERLQVVRLEQQRLEKQIANTIPLVDMHTGRLDEQVRELRQVEDRRQVTAEDLRELRLLLLEHISRVDNNLIAVEELEERHTRRQISELEFQANDFKERIAKLKGQVQ